MRQGTATPRPLDQAQADYVEARGRAMGSTTTGLRFAAWRLRRRHDSLDQAALVRLRAFTLELGNRRQVSP